MAEVLLSPYIWGGLVFGILFGVFMQKSGFCMLAALSNLVLMHDVRHLHAWMTALLVAIPGTILLEYYGLVDIGAVGFRQADTQIGGPVLGGLVFGIGTVLAGGCASRTLIRSSEGDLGALIVFSAFTATAMITLYGILAIPRDWLQSHTVVGPGLAIPEAFSVSPLWYALMVVLGFVAYIAFSGRQGYDWRLILWGGCIGTLVVAAWWFTGNMAQDEFNPQPAQSLAVVGPAARAGVWLTTASLSSTGFGVALIIGTITGGMVSALVGQSFRIKIPEQSRLPVLISGGMLMGIGAVTAGGCNIGQGITGMSTCAVNSLVAVLFMFVGMRLGLTLIFRKETFVP
ncbi:MAG: YeeE/YedE family protein [Gammaproteobacteria bacterium]|nr:YeeE/YedE family protein [Gammaproteobacteria bacterium]